MNAVDTNVLIRFLVRDDEHQSEIVYNTLKKAEAGAEVLFVPMLVCLEVIWVLESVYAIDRDEIIDSFEALLSMPVLQFEAQSTVRRFIGLAQKSKTDLPDLLIAAAGEAAGCERVLTFDKRAAAFELFALL